MQADEGELEAAGAVAADDGTVMVPEPAADAEAIRTAPVGMVPSVRKLAPRLVVAGVLPIVGYALLRPHVSSDFVALLAVSIFPIIDIAVERVRTKHFDPIGVIALVGITVGIIGAIAFNGDATLLKVRESALTGVFGLVCLVSLVVGRRPVMYYLARAFSTGGDAEKVAEFDEIWELPGVPRRFRLVTAVWAIFLLAECVVRTWLAYAVSTEVFLEITPVINWTILGGLLAWTTWYSRRGEQAVLADLETAPPAS